MRLLQKFSCLLTLAAAAVLPVACGSGEDSTPLFTLIPPGETGIEFVNLVEEGPGNNILESEFFFNGAGVAVGDINGNGLPDLYFTANQGENALYLNHGNFQFENITTRAGVSDAEGWSAGTAMVDINGNGLLDIYVCKAGQEEREYRKNKLFINNGDETFSEKAAEYGLDDPGYCTQPVFFDYNGNGLLDVFIVNYSTKPAAFDLEEIRHEVDPYIGDKLYKNNGDGTFTDVSRQAGIIQNPIGFGLSATASDLTGNGLPDIYVANDFIERDYMYINQGDGTFRDEILERTDLISYYSMGSDIADINNDGLPDIFVADMLPPDYSRRRTFRAPDYSRYEELATKGYHRKNMRNVLQLNNGDGSFTEVGQLAGVAMSDWSWAALLADFTNDGHKDLYITNGFGRYYTNRDYLHQVLWAEYPDENFPDDEEILWNLVQQMPKVEMHNYAFRNLGELHFEETTGEWGLALNSISGGAAYADLNNDGSLDLVVSNMNEPPFIFRNNAQMLYGNHYLKVRLEGEGSNTRGTGSKVRLTGEDGTIYFQEAYQTRGYQSTVDPVLHFGLGGEQQVDVEIIWPDQSRQNLQEVSVNQTLTLRQGDAVRENGQQEAPASAQQEPAAVQDPERAPEAAEDKRRGQELFLLLDQQLLGLGFYHQGSLITDRMTNPLLPHTLSNLSPALAVGDVNNDQLADVFVGGGQGQPAALYLQQSDGTFSRADIPAWEEHREQEEIDAVFFDANGNGHKDLYVVSGGNFDRMNGEVYQDRLYLNDGFGNFSYAPDALPRMHTSGGSVTVLDLDGNGKPDLFVGGRVVTGQYPKSPRSYLLKNNGGSFEDITEQAAPELMEPGMVTDALWADIDNDGNAELVITGEWMPIRIFKQSEEGTFRETTAYAGLQETGGWWNVIKAVDLNQNGHLDLIAGNRGLNSDLNTTPENPVILYYGDFNDNGLSDPIITQMKDGRRYPLPDRDALLRQIPEFEERFPDYASFSTATIEDILSRHQRQEAERFYVHTFESTLFKNNGNGRFQPVSMPRQAQIAPVHDLLVADFYGNEVPDILLAGNNFGVRPERGPMAGQGLLLQGSQNEEFVFHPRKPSETGGYAIGEVRNIELAYSRFGPVILLGRHNAPVIPYFYNFPDQ